MPVDAVLFDLDDTLVTYERSGAEILAAAFDRVDVDPVFDIEDYHARFGEFLGEAADAGEFRARVFADLAAEAGRDPEEGRAVAAAYTDERDPTGVRALPGAVETVRSLAGDHDLGLVTNGPPGLQRPKLDAVGLDDAFETVVFAGFETAPKPAAEPFRRALDDLGVGPDRAVHVGNSLSSDVAGAAAGGLQSAWVPRSGAPDDPDPEPDFTCPTLHAVRDRPWA